MNNSRKYRFQGKLDFGEIEFISLLDHFDQGVLMTDIDGVLVYYNEVQAQIDNLHPSEALGKNITDVYEYDNDSSTCMRCLKHGRPIINYALSYRSQKANVGNTIHSVFPLHDRQGNLIGTICFVKDYNMYERTIPSFLNPKNNDQFAEGTQHTFASIIGSAPELVRAVKTAKMASDSPSAVLLHGETGVGKELFAQSIHNFYYSKKGRYVAINCAAIPETLIEGILFGTVKGAYTGALDRAGLFERANGGTIFLDEIDSMPISLQGKLLRVLQENEVRRVGAMRAAELNLKVISSMNVDPKDAVRQALIRSDLYYRLAVISIPIPPLRKRLRDLEELVRHFILKYNTALGKNVFGISSSVTDLFHQYHWPGNVRELEHIIESAINMISRHENWIRREHLHFHLDYLTNVSTHHATVHEKNMPYTNPHGTSNGIETVRFLRSTVPNPIVNNFREMKNHLEIDQLKQALVASGGNVAKAAKALGMSRQLMHYKVKKYNLRPR
jgi:arginine utilization regulatory protein